MPLQLILVLYADVSAEFQGHSEMFVCDQETNLDLTLDSNLDEDWFLIIGLQWNGIAFKLGLLLNQMVRI